MGELAGYRGEALSLLENAGLSIGDLVKVETNATSFEGYLMPRYELADNHHIVIKLKNGYNIGISIKKVRSITKIAEGEKPKYTPALLPKFSKDLPKVLILSTGGTIASRIDYRTGGVHPALTAEDLYTSIPEIAEIAQVDAEVLFSVFSENLRAEHWCKIAEHIASSLYKGYRGVVVTHGTDTMGYTAAALSFALKGIPVPVVLVGAQRSSDRPSSDAATNLLAAVSVASKATFSGVYVAMHAGLSDDVIAVHHAASVRKNHTSRRDAFQSINRSPVAYVKDGVIQQVTSNLPPRGESTDFRPSARFEEQVALLKFHPNFDATLIDYLVDKGVRGLVLEGTGLGHVGHYCYDSIKRAVGKGVLVGMCSQCIWGRVRMTVYDTGRDLLNIGVLPLDTLFPEVALVKMMWVLGNTKTLEEARELMLKDLVGEMVQRLTIEERRGFEQLL
ncbi:MAG: Glu-tRNA(Gln) amidotransferase subunit GatD [Nitrososphaerales archaeon]